MTTRILVSNDDGYNADGIEALAAAMMPLGEVWVVAPESQQSAASHAISLHRPLRLREIGPRWYAVDGTPTDCAYMAINHLMKDAPPTLAVSGINHGPNLADDVTYSGTVAAAMEATLLGVPAIAFSLATRQGFDFGVAARFASEFVRSALAHELPRRMLLNVNVPPGADVSGYAVTRLGKHSYGSDVVVQRDPRGRDFFWIGGNEYSHEDIPGSDCRAVYREGRISVTPLHLQLTDLETMDVVRAWNVNGFVQG